MKYMGRWHITTHAVDAYRRRVKWCSFKDAVEDLIKISEEAHYVRDTKRGAQMWRGPRWCRVRLVVRDGVLLTVLSIYDDAPVPTRIGAVRGYEMEITFNGERFNKVDAIDYREAKK